MNYNELPELPEHYKKTLGVTYNNRKFVICFEFNEETEELSEPMRYFMDSDVENQVFGLTLEDEVKPTYKLTGEQYWELMRNMFPEYFKP